MGYAEELFLVCMTLLLMYSWMKPRSRADLLARRRSSRRRLQVAVLANSDHPLHFRGIATSNKKRHVTLIVSRARAMSERER